MQRLRFALSHPGLLAPCPARSAPLPVQKHRMQQSPGRKTTAVGADGVRPTDYQIRSGHFVIPAGFYEANKHALAWKLGFDVVAFGSRYEGKQIDEDRRLNVRLREHITPGDVIRLSINERQLHVVKDTESTVS